MRVASLVMAVIGTVFGIIFGLFAMAVGGAADAVGAEGGSTVSGLGVSAILACVIGMLCSGFHFAGIRPGLMTLGLFIAAFWHVISISFFGLPGFLFLLMAAIFAAFGRSPRKDPYASIPLPPTAQRAAIPYSEGAGWVAPPGFKPYVPPAAETSASGEERPR